MPIALDSGETFEVALPCDEGRSEVERPVFVCRYLVAKRWREMARVGDESDGKPMAGEDILDRACEAIRLSLCGWRNMPAPYTEDADLLDMLTVSEVWELYYRVRGGSCLSVSAKKGSASPSPTASAESAPAAVNPAETGPTSDAPLPLNAPAAVESAATIATADASR